MAYCFEDGVSQNISVVRNEQIEIEFIYMSTRTEFQNYVEIPASLVWAGNSPGQTEGSEAIRSQTRHSLQLLHPIQPCCLV